MIKKEKEERELKERERRLKKGTIIKDKKKREKDELDKIENEKRNKQEKEIMDKIEQEEEQKRERLQKEMDKIDKQRKELYLREQEKKKKTLREKILKDKEKKEKERQHFEELLEKEKERIKKKKETEKKDNNDSTDNKIISTEDNKKQNIILGNTPNIKKNNFQNLRNKLYSEKPIKNQNYSNILKKNNTDLINNYIKSRKFNTLSSNKKNETTDKETEAEDNLEDKNNNNSRKFCLSYGKHEKFKKVKWGDPLNPYMTNWPSSFLKIGYNVGFHYNQLQKGVPLLRIQKLKKNVVFPPLYTIQYSKYTDDYNHISEETEKLCCNSVVKKLFNQNRNKFGLFESYQSQPKKNYQTHYNKAFFPKDNEMNINLIDNKVNSEKNLIEIMSNTINNENKEDNKDTNKEILILDYSKRDQKE